VQLTGHPTSSSKSYRRPAFGATEGSNPQPALTTWSLSNWIVDSAAKLILAKELADNRYVSLQTSGGLIESKVVSELRIDPVGIF